MFDEKVRSFLKLFWLLPLIAAPGLVLLGYYEAHQEHLVTFHGNTNSHLRGVYHTDSLPKYGDLGNVNAAFKDGNEETHPMYPSQEREDEKTAGDGDTILSEKETEELHNTSYEETGHLLQKKHEHLKEKLKKQKVLIAQLQEEGKKLSAAVDQQVCLTKKFATPGSLRVVALASAPGSGNTWTRHLLESASGIYTGSIYRDKKLYRAGFYGEYEDYVAGTVLVVKCHRFKAENSEKFETAIVLVRNPYKALISEYNRILTGKNHTAVANPSDFSGEDWVLFVKQMGDKWFGIIEKWLAKDPNIHIVYYENLLKDARGELEKMLEFLNIDIDPARMDCTIANQEGNFHRKSTKEFNPFTEELNIYLNGKIKRAQDLLTAYRKPPPPEEYFAKGFR